MTPLRFSNGLKPERGISERGQEYLDFAATRDEQDRSFIASVPEWMSEEESLIAQALEGGKVFVVNGDHQLVHNWDCAAIRPQMDRQAAWDYYAPQAVEGSKHSVSGPRGRPKMPNLLARDDVEALKRYKTCAKCAPDVSHREKRRAGFGRRPITARGFGAHHIGRQLESAEGQALGDITSVSILHDANGTTVTLQTTTTTLHLGEEDQLVLVERKHSGAESRLVIEG